MSENTEGTFKVPLTKVVEVNEHTNAHSLDVVKIYGFDVIVKKDSLIVGDVVLYLPVDSIISPELENHLFPIGSKIKLSKQRIKQIRIRKIASQGMIINPDDIKKVFGFTPDKLEKCYMNKIDVIKFEPPKSKFQPQAAGKKKRKPLENSNFQKYNGLTNIKWCPYQFKEGERVVYQEKIHGTNARAGNVPYQANAILKKIKKFFGFAPKYEFVYGSNNMQLQNRMAHKGFYGEDVYGKVFGDIDAASKIPEGYIVYGEIYGDGIQKNYNYGLKGEQKFVLFDVKELKEGGTQSWLDPVTVQLFAEAQGFDMVPSLYDGPFVNAEHAKTFTLGASVLNKKQQVREGIVVKAFEKYSDFGSKRALKVISEKYLDKDQSDFH